MRNIKKQRKDEEHKENKGEMRSIKKTKKDEEHKENNEMWNKRKQREVSKTKER